MVLVFSQLFIKFEIGLLILSSTSLQTLTFHVFGSWQSCVCHKRVQYE